jgi:hypothetical protein
MAKTTGLGDGFYLGGYDLSGDIGSLSAIHGGSKPLEVTAINKSAFERIGGPRDGGMKFMAYYNPAAGQAHPVLSALPLADVVATYRNGSTLGNAGACLVAKQVSYDPTRGNDGALTFETEALANGYGLEWGEQHTAGLRTDTAATNGTGVDSGSGGTTNFGLQAYVQVTAFAGTDVTIKLQESSDNGADVYANVTGGAFTQVTAAPVAERIATSPVLAVERYLRVVTSTTGGFTSLSFNVVVVRNRTAIAF